ncbi:MAG: bifunctional glycosyltransferase family 2/GtrA family protein [Lachnospiraceae bacterium]|nr:bifunctional glycosyltransferase family 2/GtrA family protein [Lachnospiraceae bacterium]
MKMQIALIPAYEPLEMLIGLSKRLKEAGFTVIIIDDGSGDAYCEIFKSAAVFATVLTYSENKGKGYALKTGLAYIKNNFFEDCVIVTLDSDGQHRVEDAILASDMVADNDNCLLLGSRSFEGDVPLRSRFGNMATRFIYKLFTGMPIKDTQTGLRAFKARLIPFMLSVKGERYEYEMNVLLECSRKNILIKEMGIETIYIDNNSGSHFNTVKDSFLVYREIIKFAASSFTGFIVDYGMYSLLIILTGGLGTSLSVPLSNVLARITSASVNYAINKRYVFKSEESVAKTAAQYFALAACILFGNTILLSYLVNSLHVNKFVGKMATEIIFFTLSWIAQKFIIFKKKTINPEAGKKRTDVCIK